MQSEEPPKMGISIERFYLKKKKKILSPSRDGPAVESHKQEGAPLPTLQCPGVGEAPEIHSMCSHF